MDTAHDAALAGIHFRDQRLERMTDEELARETLCQRRRLVLADEAVTAEQAAEVGLPLDELRDWWRLLQLALLAGCEIEERRRERAAARGVPREGAAGRVPDNVVQEIKRRVRLDALLERYGATRLGWPDRRGRRRGLCPFCHRGQPPGPFYVYLGDPDDEHYFCHACTATGDVITFVQRWQRVGFRQTVEGLASSCGLDWSPTTPAPASPRALGARRRGPNPRAGRVRLGPAREGA